ncbi:MAG: hypothetical protein GY859_00055, partial [Desulfobacterales bacterium]|nr:hypothetical protein [Desulfobacterales bacterium]
MISNLFMTPNLLNGAPIPTGGVQGANNIGPEGLTVLNQGGEPGGFGIALERLMKAAGLMEMAAEGELQEAAAESAGMESILVADSVVDKLMGANLTMEVEGSGETPEGEELAETDPALLVDPTENQVLDETLLPVPIALTVETANNVTVNQPATATAANDSGAIPAIEISAPGVDEGRTTAMNMTPGASNIASQGEAGVNPGQAASQRIKTPGMDAASAMIAGNENNTGAETPAVNPQAVNPAPKAAEAV